MLLDTSGLLSLLHEAEPFHHKANHFYHAANTRLTHNYVLAEFIALAHARRIPRPKVLSFHRVLIDNPDIEAVWVDPRLHLDAAGLLARRLDKTYSLCDAVSFILMRQRNVSEVLTTDHHFEQEGFVPLLK